MSVYIVQKLDWKYDDAFHCLSDEQKAALWRLLDPQPWEIVEVELEVGR
ncbi:MAG: hypothetical protein NTX57_22460 [Armatimonadetes bacterium]|jgi:hypothetical protein|nr:hypothetical protein [Armatimonadota bacterium]